MSTRLTTVGGRTAQFIHQMKTGGTWCHRVFQRAWELGLLKDLDRPKPEGISPHGLPIHYEPADVYLTFIRNPVTWYESYWKWSRTGVATGTLQNGLWYPDLPLRRFWDPDFMSFMRKVNKLQPGFVTRMYESVIGVHEATIVEHVGDMENMEQGILTFLHSVLNLDVTALAKDPIMSRKINTGGGSRPRWDASVLEETIHLETPTYMRFYGSHNAMTLFADLPITPPLLDY